MTMTFPNNLILDIDYRTFVRVLFAPGAMGVPGEVGFSVPLDEAINAIHVRFGEHALARASAVAPPQPWPTGVETVDRLSGLGGLPKGRLSVLQGPTGSGKSSLALALLASATRELAQAVVIDPSRRFDPWALLPFRPQLEALTVARPPDPTSAAEAAIALARAGAAFILVFLWDGTGASPTWWGSLEAAAQRSGAVVLWVTDSMPAQLAHGSSFTLSVSRSDWVWEHGQLVGVASEVRCVKNKVSAIAGMAAAEVSRRLEIRYPIGAEVFPDMPLDDGHGEVRQEVAWQARSAAV
jgi:energy-coupling factor transporter ATP-binding protein EcfA2